MLKKLCLWLCYTCTKLRHYLLYNTCVVAYQVNVIKHMLHRPILSGRISKWAYALAEFDLAFEPLETLKGEILADFIVEHRIDVEDEISYVSFAPWKLYFDESACKEGQGIGVVIVSPNGIVFETSR